MQQYGFYFNAKRCTGCKTCEMACKDYKNLNLRTAFRQVYEIGGGDCRINSDGSVSQNCFSYYISSACNHCTQPVCMEVCPTGAMSKNDLGLVFVDEKRCIGCGYCAMTCPYHAPQLDYEVGHSVKCDGCMDRVREGLLPICVEACPVRALDFGLMDELTQTYGTSDAVPPLPPYEETYPNLIVVSPACLENMTSDVLNTAKVVNTNELV